MAKIHCILDRLEDESIRAFKTRCGSVLPRIAADAECGFAVGRMSITAAGLDPDMKWGAMHEELPSDRCVIASYTREAARLAFHAFDGQELAQAPINPVGGRLKGVFRTVYEQHRDLNGKFFDVIREIDTAQPGFDLGVLPMFQIQFESGKRIEAWPEELVGSAVEDFIAGVRDSMSDRLKALAESAAGAN